MANNKLVTNNRIRAYRLMKGFSQSYMSNKLEMDQAKYSKLESGKMAIRPELLEKIASVLETSTEELSSTAPLIVNNHTSNQGANQGCHIENFFADQKELFDIILAEKNKEIDRLAKQVEQLMSMLDKNRK